MSCDISITPAGEVRLQIVFAGKPVASIFLSPKKARELSQVLEARAQYVLSGEYQEELDGLKAQCLPDSEIANMLRERKMRAARFELKRIYLRGNVHGTSRIAQRILRNYGLLGDHTLTSRGRKVAALLIEAPQ